MEKQQTDFDRFWAAYPKRKGSNPKAPAAKKFTRIVSSGIDPESIISGAQKYSQDEKSNIGSPYIAQAITWLNQSRWQDYQYQPKPTGLMTTNKVFVREGTPQWEAWQEHLLRTTGRRSPVRNFGWWFPQELPPNQTTPGASK